VEHLGASRLFKVEVKGITSPVLKSEQGIAQEKVHVFSPTIILDLLGQLHGFHTVESIPRTPWATFWG